MNAASTPPRTPCSFFSQKDLGSTPFEVPR
jgi:hypothetical protein